MLIISDQSPVSLEASELIFLSQAPITLLVPLLESQYLEHDQLRVSYLALRL